jgi:UPF0271 protein
VGVVLERFGDSAIRVRLPEAASGPAVLDALRSLPGVLDAVVCERHALVVFDPASPPAGVADAVARAIDAPRSAAHPREHTVHVRYDGEDLDEIATRTGIGREQVAALHTAGRYVVAAVGFLPGFAYLRGLDPRLVVPRRAVPRPRVAAFSVAVAGPYAGVYPFASPGGWNIVGSAVGFAPFDARSGAKLALGDRVRFEPVTR